jgi:hypothetical protein
MRTFRLVDAPMLHENGGQWAHTLAQNLDLAYRKAQRVDQPVLGGVRDGLVELMGADRVCFGSDLPHPEGLAEPLQFLEHATDVAPEQLERIMSTNMFELLGLSRPVPAGVLPA